MIAEEALMGVRIYPSASPVHQGEWIVMGPRPDGCPGQIVLFGPDTLLACNQAREHLAPIMANLPVQR